MSDTREIVNAFFISAAFTAGLLAFGCDRKETVLEIDTPDGGVTVQRDVDDGSISVDVGE